MLAIDRSISAQRMTKVSPTAMMPVTDTWVRMLPTLSSVAKEGLAAAKKPLRQGQKRRDVAHLGAQKSGDPARLLSLRCRDALTSRHLQLLTPLPAGGPC